MTTTGEILTCGICGSRPATYDTAESDILAAIQEGWVPSYFEGDEPIDTPVCPDCVQAYLRVADDGELEVRPSSWA